MKCPASGTSSSSRAPARAACSRTARVGMAASRSPTRSSVGTSNGTRRRPGEHRDGSTQAGHGGTVLSATNRLQRQSRTPIQPAQSDPPVDQLEPERVEQRQHVAGHHLRGRNLDLARRSSRNLVGPGRAPGRGERAAGSSDTRGTSAAPAVMHQDRLTLARLRQLHPQISGSTRGAPRRNLRKRVSAPHVRVMPPRAARSECLAGRCSGAADRRPAPARAAAPSC